MEVAWWHLGVGWSVSMLGGGASGATLKHYVFDRPKVRLRAMVVGAERMEPIVVFKLTNTRKDEVHVSALLGVAKRTGQKATQFLVTTKPNKMPSFRLPGLERVMFEAKAEEVFPSNYGIDDVTEFHVEDITSGKRWKLPSGDLKRIREEVREAVDHYRETAMWSLICRTCKGTTHWRAKRPKPTSGGGFSYGFGFTEHEGWTEPKFEPFMIEGTGLCPGCSTTTNGEQPSGDTAAAE
jgi:hypothetical protein